MSINEDMVTVYLDLKIKHNWSDKFFIQLLTTCNVPRQVVAAYFDKCVALKGMKPLEEMENVSAIREQVMSTTLSKSEKLELGKCIGFLNQLKSQI